MLDSNPIEVHLDNMLGWERYGQAFRVGIKALALVALPLLPTGQIDAGVNAPNVAYGGFAFSGNAADTNETFPYSSQIGIKAFEKTAVRVIDRFIESKEAKSFELSKGLVRLEETSAVLAVALTEESVFTESFADVHKLVINLGFEILVLDFKAMEVRSSVPVYIEFIDAKKTPFSNSEITTIVRNLTTESGCALEKTLSAKLSKILIRDHNAATLQVTEVILGEKYLSFIPHQKRDNVEALRRNLAATFTSLFSSKTRVSMLPYAKDGLNTKMALRFSDASVLGFSIPAPTFAISLDVKGFRKIKSKETPAETLYIYGSYLGAKVYEPEFSTVYFTGTAKYPVSKVVPSSSKGFDEYPIVSEALIGSMLEAVEMITSDAVTNDKVIKKCLL